MARCSERQYLILIKGLPGSGKSTLAAALAAALRCPLVDKDDARDCFSPDAVPIRPRRCEYDDCLRCPECEFVEDTRYYLRQVDWNALSYDVMFRTAARQLGLGLSVVLDCPFSRRELYDRACQMAGNVAAAAAAAAAPAEAPVTAPEPQERRAPQEAEEETPATEAPSALPQLSGAPASTAELPPPPPPAATPPLVVLVDVECGDEAEWRRRVEERGARDAGTERDHKPCSWLKLQGLMASYNGCWKWSTDGSVRLPHHVRVCTASASTDESVRRVLQYMESIPTGATSATLGSGGASDGQG